MSASPQLSQLLVPLCEENVRLLVPLYVDTFPLWHFYTEAGSTSRAAELAMVTKLNDYDALLSVLAQVAKDMSPVGIYFTGDQARFFSDKFRETPWQDHYDVREIAVSTFRVGRFFVPPDSFGGRRETSVDGLIERCHDVETIVVHSDVPGLADSGSHYLANRIEQVCRNWPSCPMPVSRRSEFPLSHFRSPRSQKLLHVYWLSDVGQAALRKTARDFMEFSIPEEPNETRDASVLLKLFLLLPHSMAINTQGKLVASIDAFHECLFSLDAPGLSVVFDPIWRLFMLLFVSIRWPVFNLFESVEEYTQCFREHHVFNGRRRV